MTTVWDDDQRMVFSLCSFISSSLSLAGSIFIMVSFFAFFRSRRKQLTQRLVLYLSLCHFALSVCWLVGGPVGTSTDNVCYFLAPLRFYTFIASFFWTSAIATEMLLMWFNARFNQLGELVVPQTSSLRRELFYHAGAWGVPLLITIWPTIFHKHEQGMWECWFEDSYWTFLFLGLVAVACVYCLVVYCVALYKYRSRAYESGSYSDIERAKRTELKFRVTGYLLAFLITWTPLTILRIMESVDHERSVGMFVMTVISASLVPLTGFLDSIIYGWDRKLWECLGACLTCSRYRRRRTRSALLRGNATQATINGLTTGNSDERASPYGVSRLDTEETFAFSDSD